MNVAARYNGAPATPTGLIGGQIGLTPLKTPTSNVTPTSTSRLANSACLGVQPNTHAGFSGNQYAQQGGSVSSIPRPVNSTMGSLSSVATDLRNWSDPSPNLLPRTPQPESSQGFPARLAVSEANQGFQSRQMLAEANPGISARALGSEANPGFPRASAVEANLGFQAQPSSIQGSQNLPSRTYNTEVNQTLLPRQALPMMSSSAGPSPVDGASVNTPLSSAAAAVVAAVVANTAPSAACGNASSPAPPLTAGQAGGSGRGDKPSARARSSSPNSKDAASRALYTDGTTGFKGCTLTLPKYSKRVALNKKGQKGSLQDTLQHSEDEDEDEPSQAATPGAKDRGARSASPPRAWHRHGSPAPITPPRDANSSPSRADARRHVDRCHADLYEDAFARQQRNKDLKEHFQNRIVKDDVARMQKFEREMRDRQKTYRLKDTRSFMEREEELLRKRKAKESLAKSQEDREEEELKACTFKPEIRKKIGRGRCELLRSPRGRRGDEDLPNSIRLQRLLDRQRHAITQFQAIANEETALREHLRTAHSELHDRVQREETQRVVGMLQDSDAEGSTQRELIQRVRSMVSQGHDPESAQKQIVEELVARSQDEVRRRVFEAFSPMRLEAEGDLYTRRLALVHDLETVEAQAVALKGGALVEEAKELGFEFGLAEKTRRGMPPAPSPALFSNRPGTPKTRSSSVDQNSLPSLAFGSHARLQSRDSSQHMSSSVVGRLPASRSGTPRSAHTPISVASQSPSRQSSGQQPSLSGSVLQPPVYERHVNEFADDRSTSQISLPSGVVANANLHTITGSGQVQGGAFASRLSTGSVGGAQSSPQLVGNASGSFLGVEKSLSMTSSAAPLLVSESSPRQIGGRLSQAETMPTTANSLRAVTPVMNSQQGVLHSPRSSPTIMNYRNPEVGQSSTFQSSTLGSPRGRVGSYQMGGSPSGASCAGSVAMSTDGRSMASGAGSPFGAARPLGATAGIPSTASAYANQQHLSPRLAVRTGVPSR
eukprot:TRINITY_DN18268_c0_g1_i1.p1 TRINITY_DN18268_c0_g1~~TRINITY_DN18268_c0_g1_i1.p1  ORF type:complete len:1003 (-),score=144.21 TRINITY_DN18268_c0_g1_i1:158-3166(-)